MCGIAGVIAKEKGRDVGPLLERLTTALAHRGPDGSGFQYARGRSVGLGHRRLSIVDVEGGAQPMANEDGTVWVVLNGELYNHLELRRELEAGPPVQDANADTEVLVHGWEEWGSELLERLNGIYAFGLLDLRGQSPNLWLARDPVGVKPLYLGVTRGEWWFTSELAAARACDLLDSELRSEAFDEYLVYRFVPSPGHVLSQRVETAARAFLPLVSRRTAGTSDFPAFETVSCGSPEPMPGGRKRCVGLAAAVRRQLMSDVPVGSLLSGGVDSTVITQLMRESLDAPPSAFAIGFSGDDSLDELAAGATRG